MEERLAFGAQTSCMWVIWCLRPFAFVDITGSSHGYLVLAFILRSLTEREDHNL